MALGGNLKSQGSVLLKKGGWAGSLVEVWFSQNGKKAGVKRTYLAEKCSGLRGDIVVGLELRIRGFTGEEPSGSGLRKSRRSGLETWKRIPWRRLCSFLTRGRGGGTELLCFKSALIEINRRVEFPDGFKNH